MKFRGVFIMSYAYIGNTQFEVFDNHNNLIYSSIQSDFNISFVRFDVFALIVKRHININISGI